MIKKLFLILCALVLCSSSYAGNIKDIKKVIARKNAYPDLLFFWTCETANLGASDYSAGDTTGSVFDGGALNATAMKIGTNGIWTDATGNDRYQFDHTIIDGTSGNVAFWMNIVTWVDGRAVFSFTTTSPSTNYFKVEMRGADTPNIELMFRWDDTDSCASCDFETTTLDLSEGTWYFVEVVYDAGTDLMGFYITPSGGARGSLVSTTSNAISPIPFGTGPSDFPYAVDAIVYLDNIMISNDSTRNLSLIRNLTASPK